MIRNLSKKLSFSRNEADVMKGIAVCFLLIHHLCSETMMQIHPTTSLIFSTKMIIRISTFSKVCLALFVFVSSYGITKSMEKVEEINVEHQEIGIIKRFLKLFLNYFFVFIIVNIFSMMIPAIGHNFRDVYWSNGYFYGILYFLCDLFCLSTIIGTPTMNRTWWWMPVALVITFLVPMMQKAIKKYGIFVFLAAILIPYIIGLELGIALYLLPTLVLGIYSAQRNIFEALVDFMDTHKFKGWILLFILNVFALLFIFSARIRIPSLVTFSLLDSLFAINIAVFVLLISKYLQPLLVLFRVIGKQSLYIFLLHSFIYYYWFGDFVYIADNWAITCLIVLMLSFIASVVLSAVRKYSGFDRLTIVITNFCLSLHEAQAKTKSITYKREE